MINSFDESQTLWLPVIEESECVYFICCMYHILLKFSFYFNFFDFQIKTQVTMDPRRSGQDVVRCTLCKDAVAPMYCEVCHIYLCQECVATHLADQSNVHKVVSLTQFLSSPKCPDHPTKQCEFHCKHCDVPICSQCVILKTHKHHDVIDLIENSKNKKKRFWEKIYRN